MSLPTNLPLGTGRRLIAARQANIRTQAPVATPARQLNFYELNASRAAPFADDRLLGAPLQANNVMDRSRPGPGLVTATWSAVVPMGLTQIGYWLQALLPNLATSGTTTRTHTFTSGNAGLLSHTFEVQQAGGNFDVVTGAVATEMTVAFDPSSDGYQQVQLQGFARDVAESQSTAIAWNPAATLLALGDRPAQYTCGVSVGGSAFGAVLGGTFRLRHEVTQDRYADGGALIGEAFATGTLADFDLRCRFTGAAQRALAAVAAGETVGPSTAVALQWQLSATSSLTINLPNARFEPGEVSGNGPGGMELMLRGRGEQTSGAAAVSVVLVNALTGYP